MTDIAGLLANNIDIWTGAIQRKSGAGRGGGKRISLYGIERLRALILDLAVRGKLVPQDVGDEPASDLLKRIERELRSMAAAGVVRIAKSQMSQINTEVSLSLPDRWIWVKLGDICGLENGDRGKDYPNKSALVSEGIPFVNAGHLCNGKVDKAAITYISEDRYNALGSGKFKEGDILFCLRGSLGKCAIVSGLDRGAIASSLVIIRLVESVDRQFAMAYFNSSIAYAMIRKYDNGTAQPNLSSADLSKFLLPLPPLAEQRRIMAKVDELLALCDALEQESADAMAAHQALVDALLATLVNSADAAALSRQWARLGSHFDTLFTTDGSIDALKQAIVDLAVSGKWSSGSAENWVPTALGTFVRDAAAGWSPKCIETPRSGTDWGVLKVSAVTWGSFQPAENKQLPASFEPRPEIEVRPGDFLISRANTADLVARSVVVPEGAPAKLMMSDKIIRFRFNGKIEPEWVNLFHASTSARAYYARVAGGTSSSMKNVSQAQIRAVQLPVPPLTEQRRIVAKVYALMSLCGALKARLADSAQTQRHLADAITERAAA